ncbi:hypothetical protein SCAZ3_01165 [Streptococcus canis FSL Z3-227]|uniref:Uncharacterized protein n=1 Tax=Streptococcus canis FSL Z3-227 TaxID=482234 RepID=A0AAV3FPM8_STRCB|nr:hypothetical protein SCAZ3_01165 [Streptococcus canis FSL Z3-227]
MRSALGLEWLSASIWRAALLALAMASVVSPDLTDCCIILSWAAVNGRIHLAV